MTKLKVTIDSDSYLLQNNLYIEVRDSRLQLVDSFFGGKEIDVEPGLYQVSSVLEDGKNYNKIISAESDKQNDVVLSSRDAFHSDDDFTQLKFGNDSLLNVVRGPLDSSGPLTEGVVYSDGILSSKMWERLRAEYLTPHLKTMSGVNVSSNNQTRWYFIPENNYSPEVIPTAKFVAGKNEYTFSLPINPLCSGPESACLVDFKLNNKTWSPHVSIAKQRTVASALLNMLDSNQIIRAADVAKEATELLRGKYSDPVGAVLGSLILNKVGLLGDRISWLENLAKDFKWIPDGSVLLAYQLSIDKDEDDRALDLLLSTVNKRMMFTECYSLMVNLLRRWPSEAGKEIRSEALKSISADLAAVDWNLSIYSTNVRTHQSEAVVQSYATN